MITYLISLTFTLSTLFVIWFVYRITSAVPIEDRTYADKPPKLLLRIWPLVNFLNFYCTRWLTVEFREKTLRQLRKVELDYAVSPQQWFAAKLAYAFIIALFAALMGLWLEFDFLMFMLTAGVAGFFYLDLWLKDRLKVIEIQVLKNLPTFLDMLTLAVESGCNLTVGINIAVEKTPDNPLRRAFARLLREVRSGKTRIDALRAIEERMDLPAITSLITALVQAEKTGASLGSVLRAQSTQRTNERFSRAEKLAMEAPVKMLGPLILCIFPCTFVVLGFPIGMKMMNAFQ